MTFQESRKTKNVKNGHNFFDFIAIDLAQRPLFLFFNLNFMRLFNFFQIEQAVLKVI
jgi:hypothetical protein